MMLRTQFAELHHAMLRTFCRRDFCGKHKGPAVSICFDDFPRTAYTEGGRILSSYGVHGTYYAALGLTNTSNALGEMMTRRDLDGVLADGHELGSHTFHHYSVRKVGLGEFVKDAIRGGEAVRKLTGTEPVSFSYPFGHATLASKQRLSQEVRSSRGIQGGINAPSADLNLLRANCLYGDIDRLRGAEDLLFENEKRCGWLIFYTHDVRGNPSNFGCTPALFEKVVQLALDRGQSVVPVGDFLSSARAS